MTGQHIGVLYCFGWESKVKIHHKNCLKHLTVLAHVLQESEVSKFLKKHSQSLKGADDSGWQIKPDVLLIRFYEKKMNIQLMYYLSKNVVANFNSSSKQHNIRLVN